MQKYPKPTDLEILIKRLKENISIEKIQFIRNGYIAISGLGTTMLIALTQVSNDALSLEIAKFSSAIAIPFGVALAYLLDSYIHLGDEFLPKYNIFRVRKTYMLVQYVATLSILTAVFSITWFLSYLAFLSLTVSSIFAIIFFFYGYTFLALHHQNHEEE